MILSNKVAGYGSLNITPAKKKNCHWSCTCSLWCSAVIITITNSQAHNLDDCIWKVGFVVVKENFILVQYSVSRKIMFPEEG